MVITWWIVTGGYRWIRRGITGVAQCSSFYIRCQKVVWHDLGSKRYFADRRKRLWGNVFLDIFGVRSF